MGLLGEEIEQNNSGSKQKIFELAKSYRKDKTMIHYIKDQEGNVIVKGYKINQRWQEYFWNFLNVNSEDVDEEDWSGEEQENVRENLITREELEEALKGMKNDRSPGCDGIQTELIKE